jgi:hypothetical protein
MIWHIPLLVSWITNSCLSVIHSCLCGATFFSPCQPPITDSHASRFNKSLPLVFTLLIFSVSLTTCVFSIWTSDTWSVYVFLTVHLLTRLLRSKPKYDGVPLGWPHTLRLNVCDYWLLVTVLCTTVCVCVCVCVCVVCCDLWLLR